MRKETRIHNVGKTAYSTNGAGKTGHVKKKKKRNEIRPFFNTKYINKLKMD